MAGDSKVVGKVSIKVVPNTKGFRRKVEKELAGLRDLEVKLDPAGTKEFRNKVKAATKGLDAKVDLKVNPQELIAKTRSAAKAASGSAVKFRAVLDELRLRRSVRRLSNDPETQFRLRTVIDQDSLKRSVAALKNKLTSSSDTHIRVRVKADGASKATKAFGLLTSAARKAWSGLRNLGGAAATASRGLGTAGEATKGIATSVAKATPKVGKFAKVWSKLNTPKERTLGLTRVGWIVAASFAAAAPAVGLVAGALAALPSLLFAAGAAASVVALGFDGIKDAAQGAAPAVGRLKSELSGKFRERLTPQFERLGEVIDGTRESMVQVADGISDFSEGMVDAVSSYRGMKNLNGILQNTGKLFSQLQPFAHDFTDGLLEIGRAGSETFEYLAQKLNRFGQNFKSSMRELSENGTLQRGIKATYDVLGSLGNAIGKIMGAGLREFPDIAQKMSSGIERFGNAVADAMPGLADFSGKVGELLSRTASASWDFLGKSFEAAAPLLDDVSNGLVRVYEGVTDLGGAVVPGIFEFLEGLVGDEIAIALDDIGNAFSDMADKINEVEPNLTENLKTLGEELNNTFDLLLQPDEDLSNIKKPKALDEHATMLERDIHDIQNLNYYLRRAVEEGRHIKESFSQYWDEMTAEWDNFFTMDGFKNKMSQVGNDLHGTFIEPIKRGLDTAKNKIKSWFKGFKKDVDNDTKMDDGPEIKGGSVGQGKFSKWLESKLGSEGDLRAAGERFRSSFKNTWDGLKEGIGSMMDGDSWGSALDGARSSISEFFSGIGESLTEFGGNFSVDGLREKFTENIWTPISEFFTGLPERVTGLLEGVDLLSSISNLFSGGEGGEGILQSLEEKFVTPVMEFFTGLPERLSGFFEGLDILTPLTNMFSGGEGGEGLLASLETNVWTPLMDWFTQLPTKISETLSSIDLTSVLDGMFGEGFVAGITSKFEVVLNFFRELPSKVLGFLQGLPSGVAGIFSSLAGAASSIIGGMVSSVVGFISNMVSNVISFVTNMGSSIINTITTAASQFISTIMNMVSTAISHVASLPGKAQAALGNVGGMLVSSGKALIQGFIDGILSMIDAVRSAASSVVQAAKNFFPHSPAKEGPLSGRGYTTYSGQALVRDFAKGMLSEKETVREAAEDITATAQKHFSKISLTPLGHQVKQVQAPVREANAKKVAEWRKKDAELVEKFNEDKIKNEEEYLKDREKLVERERQLEEDRAQARKDMEESIETPDYGQIDLSPNALGVKGMKSMLTENLAIAWEGAADVAKQGALSMLDAARGVLKSNPELEQLSRAILPALSAAEVAIQTEVFSDAIANVIRTTKFAEIPIDFAIANVDQIRSELGMGDGVVSRAIDEFLGFNLNNSDTQRFKKDQSNNGNVHYHVADMNEAIRLENQRTRKSMMKM